MKIGVIGCGAYSLAISLMLNKNNNDITIWSESEENIRTIIQKHVLNQALPDIILPDNINYTNDIRVASEDKDIIFIIVAAQYVESVTRDIKNYIADDTVICLGTKGIDNDSLKFIHEIVLSIKKVKHISVISGGGFAIDLAHNDPIGLSLASNSKYATKVVKKALETENLKLKETTDLIGTEICGSIKNVFAIASGIIEGMGYSNSTQSFLLTEAIISLKMILKSLGANPETTLSFAGIGDIILTCTSPKSRNFKLGILLGSMSEKKDIDRFLLDNTVEGYYTLKSIYQLLLKRKVDIELIDVIYDIVYNNENPQILIEYLMNM